MKLKVHTLLSANVLIVFGYCYSILEYPNMLQHYLKIRSNLPDIICKQSVSDKAIIYDQCRKIADTPVYRLVEPDERLNDSVVEQSSIATKDEIEQYFNGQKEGITGEIDLRVPGVEYDVKVFLCVENKDKIIYIENVKLYNIFIFEKSKINHAIEIKLAIFPVYQAWDIKRRISKVLEYTSDEERRRAAYEDQLEINELLIIKGLAVSEKIQRKNGICDVKNFDLVLLCASLFGTFKTRAKDNPQNQQQPPPVLHRIRRPLSDVTCKRLPITMLVITRDPVQIKDGRKTISIDAVPCAVNSQWDEPNFYVTIDDHNSLPKLYIIEKFGKNYHVTMRMRNPRVLNDIC